jgi:hypothetical protein
MSDKVKFVKVDANVGHAVPPIKTWRECRERAAELHNKLLVYEAYFEECRKDKAIHGMQDALADIREIQAELRGIRWVLMEAP